MLTSDELAQLIEGLAGLPYGGEAVDQRRHALQCAGHAVAAGSDDELVLAAALHDIGRAEPVRAEFPGLPHEAAGEAFARDRVGEEVAWLIGQHVPAKRYLTWLLEIASRGSRGRVGAWFFRAARVSPVGVLSLIRGCSRRCDVRCGVLPVPRLQRSC
jgi:hypothetical protein